MQEASELEVIATLNNSNDNIKTDILSADVSKANSNEDCEVISNGVNKTENIQAGASEVRNENENAIVIDNDHKNTPVTVSADNNTNVNSGDTVEEKVTSPAVTNITNQSEDTAECNAIVETGADIVLVVNQAGNVVKSPVDVGNKGIDSVSNKAINVECQSMDVSSVDNQTINISLSSEATTNIGNQTVDTALVNNDDTENKETDTISVVNNSVNVEAVVNNSVNVETVVNNSVHVETVVNNSVNVETVVDNAINVETVVDNSINVETVVDNAINVETVVDNAIDVETPISNVTVTVEQFDIVSANNEIKTDRDPTEVGNIQVENIDFNAKSIDIVSESTDVVSESTDVVSESTDVISQQTEVVSESTVVVLESNDVVSERTVVVSEPNDAVSESTDVVLVSTDVVSVSTDVISQQTEVVSEPNDVVSESTDVVSGDCGVTGSNCESVISDDKLTEPIASDTGNIEQVTSGGAKKPIETHSSDTSETGSQVIDQSVTELSEEAVCRNLTSDVDQLDGVRDVISQPVETTTNDEKYEKNPTGEISKENVNDQTINTTEDIQKKVGPKVLLKQRSLSKIQTNV